MLFPDVVSQHKVAVGTCVNRVLRLLDSERKQATTKDTSERGGGVKSGNSMLPVVVPNNPPTV